MPRPLSVAFVCVLLFGTVAVQAGSPPASTDDPAISTPEGFTSTVFNVEVYENGTARWTFEYSRPLTNDSQRQQFREFADRFNSEEMDLYTNFRERARLLTDAGVDATGRSMNATGFGREARVNAVGNQGIVRMSFLWSDFAVVDGDRVRVGDVFEGGFYVGSDQWIVFETGDGLAFDPAAIEPAPDEYSATTVVESDTITYRGERDFTDNHPRVVFQPASAVQPSVTPTAESTPTPDAGDGDSAGSGGDGGSGAGGETTTPAGQRSGGGPLPMLLLGVFLVALGVGAAVMWRSGGFGGSVPAGDDGGAATADTADANSAVAGGASPEPAVPDEELLTDEDRVVRLLEANGGRMKQANIVEETGWSKSKVSMLLSDMEDEDAISKLRVGRENIVSLPGKEPDAAGSPFDDE